MSTHTGEALKFLQKSRYFLILLLGLLTIIQLTACGGSKHPSKQINNNFRLVSIDYDEGTNGLIDNKFYYEYDIDGNNIKIENSDFNNKSLSFITTKAFDKNKKLIKKTDQLTHPKANQTTLLRQWTYTYNQSGQKNSERYEDFKNNQYQYWLENKGVRTSYSKSGEIISSNRFTSDDAGNKLRELVDSNQDGTADIEINSTYNHAGKLLTKTTSDLHNSSKPKLYHEFRSYDSNGNIVQKITSQPSKNTDKNITNYQYTYDAHQNILSSSTIYKTANKQTRIDKRLYVWEEVLPIAFFNSPINWAGTGCKAGSVSISGSNTASLSILFDNYDAGKNSKTGLTRSACSFSIPIKIPSGYKITHLTADWEGYVEGKGEISRKYFLSGQAHTAWLKNIYYKPEGDNFMIRDKINQAALSSSCNGGIFNLRVDSQLKIIGDESYAAIDSTDLHNKVQLSLQFRACQY